MLANKCHIVQAYQFYNQSIFIHFALLPAICPHSRKKKKKNKNKNDFIHLILLLAVSFRVVNSILSTQNTKKTIFGRI